MTYGEHIAFLDKQIEELGSKKMSLTLPEVLDILDRDGTREGDLACQQFSKSLEWPDMSDELRMEIALRLHSARYWCLEMAKENSAEEIGSELLDNLLVGYWNDVGRINWIYAYFIMSFQEKHNYHP